MEPPDGGEQIGPPAPVAASDVAPAVAWSGKEERTAPFLALTSQAIVCRRSAARVTRLAAQAVRLIAQQKLGKRSGRATRVNTEFSSRHGTAPIRIAAIALSLGNCTVVTTDTDLSVVPGLSVESWAS